MENFFQEIFFKKKNAKKNHVQKKNFLKIEIFFPKFFSYTATTLTRPNTPSDPANSWIVFFGPWDENSEILGAVGRKLRNFRPTTISSQENSEIFEISVECHKPTFLTNKWK